MSISLTKNQGISLSKTTSSSLSNIVMGLGWDAFIIKEKKSGGFMGLGGTSKPTKVPMDVDLDASCLLLDESGSLVDVIYFGTPKLTSRCGSVVHTGDNRTGDGDGDDEQIKVNLDALPMNIKHVVFTVNAYTSGVSFNNVENAFCRLFNPVDGKEMVRTELDASGTHSAIVMAKVTRLANDWEFKALLEPCSGRTAKDIAPAVQELVRG
jgi:tellurium resistance protein TerZ